jgi:hypothetical protein
VTCKAIATFEARHDDEISFLMGDEVELCLDDADQQPHVQDDSIQWSAVQQAHLKLHAAKTLKPSPLSNPFALQPAAAEPRDTKGVSADAKATLLIPRQLSDADLGDVIELKHLRSPAWLRQKEAAQRHEQNMTDYMFTAQGTRHTEPPPLAHAIVPITGRCDTCSESAAPREAQAKFVHQDLPGEMRPLHSKEGPQDFLGRIGAGEEGGASSKSPRTWSDEVHHRYMLGKSMKDLWVPPENISRGRKSRDVLDSFSELPVDRDELKHYYLLGKSVQEMWAHGYTTDISCGRAAEHPSDSDSFPISLPKQVQIADPSISETASKELHSGRKLLPDILDVLPHVSNPTTSASARVGGGDDMSAAQLFAPAKTRDAHTLSKSSVPKTWDKVDTFAKPDKLPTFISGSYKQFDGVLNQHRSAVSENTTQKIGGREPFVPAPACTLIRVYY